MKNKLFNSSGDVFAFIFCLGFFIAGLYQLFTDSEMKDEALGWFFIVVMLAMLPIFIIKQLTRRPGR